jgi:hypothetical protein
LMNGDPVTNRWTASIARHENHPHRCGGLAHLVPLVMMSPRMTGHDKNKKTHHLQHHLDVDSWERSDLHRFIDLPFGVAHDYRESDGPESRLRIIYSFCLLVFAWILASAVCHSMVQESEAAANPIVVDGCAETRRRLPA